MKKKSSTGKKPVSELIQELEYKITIKENNIAVDEKLYKNTPTIKRCEQIKKRIEKNQVELEKLKSKLESLKEQDNENN